MACLTPFSHRQLNRALLACQLLLRRHALPALVALERVAGVQHQEPDLGYFGLWSRLEGFDQGQLTGLLEDRRAVRGTVLRGTQHIVSADFVALRPVVQPMLDRVQRGAFGGDRRRGPPGAGRRGAGGAGRAAASRGCAAERWPVGRRPGSGRPAPGGRDGLPELAPARPCASCRNRRPSGAILG